MESTLRPAAGHRGVNGGRRPIGRMAGRSVAGVIAIGADAYDRGRHLVRLIPVGPAEIADESQAGRERILAKLSRALRTERNRGRAGHWSYDLNRHLALSQAYAAEKRARGHRRDDNAGPGAGV